MHLDQMATSRWWWASHRLVAPHWRYVAILKDFLRDISAQFRRSFRCDAGVGYALVSQYVEDLAAFASKSLRTMDCWKLYHRLGTSEHMD